MDGDGYWFLVALMVGAILGIGTTYVTLTDAWEREAVQRDLALYCQTTGEWSWKGECEK